MASAEFSRHMEPVARLLLGEPNRALSSAKELRYGSRGSLAVDLTKGVWADHSASEGTPEAGGGVLDLVARETGLKGREAVGWLREHGFEVGDRDPPAPARNGHAHGSSRSPGNGAAPAVNGSAGRALIASYDYVDEAGALIFQVQRWDPKTFSQRRVMPDGSWGASIRAGHYRKGTSGWFRLKGNEAPGPGDLELPDVRQVPYRLPELAEAIAMGSLVALVEGEKDVNALWALGVPATCNAGGAGKWPGELVEHFVGADLVILPDNDEAGRKHKDIVAAALAPVAKRVRVLDLPGLPAKGDVSDWLGTGGTADALYDLVEISARRLGEEPFRSQFGALALADIDKPGPEHEYLVKGILTRGEVSMLVGPSGSGKSFLATAAALAIARGSSFFPVEIAGRTVIPRVRRGGVIYIAGEGARGLKKRLRAYLRHHDLDPSTVPFVLLTLPVDLHNSDDHTTALIQEAKQHSRVFEARFGAKLELIVLDTLSASTPGANENASDDVSRVLGRCHRIAEECDCAVQLVHHMNAGGTRERGHSSLRANVDSVIEVLKLESKDADERTMRVAKVTKQKDGEDGIAWRFILQSVEVGRDADGDPITSCVVKAPRAHDDAEQGEEAFEIKGENRRALFGYLIEALKAEGVERPANVQAPAHAVVITEEQWKALALRKAPTKADDTPEKRKDRVYTAIGRAMTAFEGWRLIGLDAPYVWLSGRKVKGFPSYVRAPKRAEPPPENPSVGW